MKRRPSLLVCALGPTDQLEPAVNGMKFPDGSPVLFSADYIDEASPAAVAEAMECAKHAFRRALDDRTDDTLLRGPSGQRLLRAGVPERQAKAFVAVLDDVARGRFDRASAAGRLFVSGFTEQQVDALLAPLQPEQGL